MTFTKLFNSITESTVWCEPDRVRIVWITMLAMADRKGRVWASVPGLAGRARVPIEDCVDALKRFQEPDPWSRTPAHEGRRIAPIAGGWILLNYEDYRNLRDEETIKESKRRYINERRARERAERVEKSSTVDHGRPQSIQAEAEAEAEAEKEKTPPTPSRGRSGHDSTFVRFWEAWPSHPRKVAKRQCADKWAKRNLAEHVDTIVAAVHASRMSPDWQRDGGRFIPAPLVWLNQDRWEATESRTTMEVI